MDSIIYIPTVPLSSSFKPFTMTISSSSISASIPLYLHQCKNIEYQEITTDPTQSSLSNPQTVYFYNDYNDIETINPTLQIDSERTDEVDEQHVEVRSSTPTTLYFINEEESEP